MTTAEHALSQSIPREIALAAELMSTGRKVVLFVRKQQEVAPVISWINTLLDQEGRARGQITGQNTLKHNTGGVIVFMRPDDRATTKLTSQYDYLIAGTLGAIVLHPGETLHHALERSQRSSKAYSSRKQASA